MDYYYKSEIEKLNPKCPPDSYVPVERISYRWVFNPVTLPGNFTAQAKKPENEVIVNDKTDKEKCDWFALSFHTNLDKCRGHLKSLGKSSGDEGYKRYGAHIAMGLLTNQDGVSGPVSTKNTHFNFHHVQEHDFGNRFEIVEEV